MHQQVLIKSDGHPLTSPTGLALALNSKGRPLLGPDLKPLYLGPDRQTLVGENGCALLGPQGHMLGLGLNHVLVKQGGAPLMGPRNQMMYLADANSRMLVTEGEDGAAQLLSFQLPYVE